MTFHGDAAFAQRRKIERSFFSTHLEALQNKVATEPCGRSRETTMEEFKKFVHIT